MGFRDGINQGSDYEYDANGNLVKDLNKNISSITYNYLNLPEEITVADSSIRFFYDATGRKVSKVVTEVQIQQYGHTKVALSMKMILLSIIHTGEGFVQIIPSTGFTYNYFLKDHLGNNRVVFGEGTGGPLVVSQSTDYYPFGQAHEPSYESGTDNKYLYNGKELQDDMLGGISLDWYDYGARFFDPQIGRWTTPDPHADRYYQWSPFIYVYNNPVNAIDPDGRDGVIIVFPDYKISTPVGKIGGIGHAGVLLIDNKTGNTRYYEYGRYDEAGIGEVRNRSVSDVKIGKDGMPTQKSLDKVMKQISDKAGHGGNIEGAYIQSDKYDEMKGYAEGKLKENSDPTRKEYSLMNNNCGTFAEDVIKQDEKVAKEAPSTIVPRPNSMINKYQKEYQGVHYDSKTGQTTIDPKKEEKK